MHIGIVAGESSGDQLGAALIEALRQYHPDIEITGMAGPKMKAAGCRPIASIDELSVMGLVEVLRKYPTLRRLRDRICDYYLASRPDVFVGIDVPDFVMGIESRLHHQQIKTVHCVAPQIWAWRQSRAKNIAKRLDLLLALFPFEVPFFRQHGVRTEFIGHPVADQFPLRRDSGRARQQLDLDPHKTYIALMPGSRRQEWLRHVDLFLSAAKLIFRDKRDVSFIAGAINKNVGQYLSRRAAELCPELPLIIRHDCAHEILRASNVALVASGTVTIEGLFAKTPMVVAYRMAPITYLLMKRMIKVPYIAMPNILAGARLLPEYIQNDANPVNLAQAINGWLLNERKVRQFETICTDIHLSLRQGAAARAASEILQLATE